MTILQKLQVRQSEIRQSLNKLLGNDARTEAEQGELEKLTGEGQQIEPEIRAAIVATPDPQEVVTSTGDPETRERLELRNKTGLADFLRAAAGGAAVTGAAAEYAASMGVPTVGHVPMEMFGRSAPQPIVETRAITPGPAVKGALQPIVPYLFERSAAATLGIMFPSVPAGQVQIAKVGTAPPSDTLAKDGSAPATAAAVSLVNQAPVRIAGSFEVRVEDLAVMPTLESALSEAMQGSLSNELDEQTFNGAAGELNGLFTQATDVAAASSVETFATGIARFAKLVDGRHSYNLGDLRAVIGSATFALYAGILSGNVSLFDYLNRILGSIRVSDRVPAVASTAQKGVVVLSSSSTPPKIHVWDAMQIVRDPYSGAGAGRVTLTATALVSPLYIPHGTSQVKEVHPKLS